MTEDKDDYKDLEKEAEQENYDKILPIPNEKLKDMKRDMDDLLVTLKPDFERFRRFEQFLFARYCNANKFTEQQIEELSEDQQQKEVFNNSIWGKSWKNGELTIKWLSTTHDNPDFWIHTCNVEWVCMFPGCHTHTLLLIAGREARWSLSACPKHYEEFRAIVKVKPFSKW
jgi:hypothetical protein